MASIVKGIKNMQRGYESTARSNLDKIFYYDQNSGLYSVRNGHFIAGKSDQMLSMFFIMNFLLKNASAVLIVGEEGTGRGLFAKAIHYNGDSHHESADNFIKVDCSEMSAPHLMYHLFDYGPLAATFGRGYGGLSRANGGTLFLENICELAPEMQMMLTTALRENYPRDVRVIASAHEHIDELVSRGKYSSELLRKLNRVGLYLPPLSARSQDDIDVLVRYMIEAHNQERKRTLVKSGPQLEIAFNQPNLFRSVASQLRQGASYIVELVRYHDNRYDQSQLISGDAFNFIRALNLPENARSLRTLLQTAISYQGVPITKETLKTIVPYIQSTSTAELYQNQSTSLLGGTKKKAPVLPNSFNLDENEKRLIEDTLTKMGGNVKMASELLGIERRTLSNKCEHHGINPNDFRK